jgi:hypothetical protein
MGWTELFSEVAMLVIAVGIAITACVLVIVYQQPEAITLIAATSAYMGWRAVIHWRRS